MDNMMSFSEYYNNIIETNPTYTSKNKNTNESYKGIVRREYPKWKGWSVIKTFRQEGISPHDIESEELTQMVENMHLLIFLQKNYN